MGEMGYRNIGGYCNIGNKVHYIGTLKGKERVPAEDILTGCSIGTGNVEISFK